VDGQHRWTLRGDDVVGERSALAEQPERGGDEEGEQNGGGYFFAHGGVEGRGESERPVSCYPDYRFKRMSLA